MNDETAPPPRESSGSADAEFVGAPEISRRVGSILDAVEREAQRLREEAREDAVRYLEHAKQRADGLVDERRRQIAEVSEELVTKSEAVVARLDDAAPVREGFENLVRALGDAAERLAQQTEVASADFEPQPFHEVRAQAQAPMAPQPPAPEQAPRAPDPAEERFDPYRGFPAQPHPARAPSTPGWQVSPAPGPPAQAPSGPAHAAPGSSGWRELDDARMVAIQMATSGGTRSSVREHLHRALGVADTASILDEIFGAGSGEDATVPWTAGPR